jgi:hypothetical protein
MVVRRSVGRAAWPIASLANIWSIRVGPLKEIAGYVRFATAETLNRSSNLLFL